VLECANLIAQLCPLPQLQAPLHLQLLLIAATLLLAAVDTAG
jgi:hypothetical protein